MSTDALRIPAVVVVALALLVFLPLTSLSAQEDEALPNGEQADEAAATDETEANDEAAADDSTTADAVEDALEEEAAARNFDRIVLNNGEVHDGEFVGLRDGKFRLTSDGFGTIVVSPSDVGRIDLVHARTFYAKPGKRISAYAVNVYSQDGSLYIDPMDDGEAMPFAPGSYQMLDPNPIPDEVWNFRAQATLSLTAGNSETLGAGLFARVSRTTDFDLFFAEYEFSYQETLGAVSERRHRGQIGYRYYFEPMWGAYGRSTLRQNLFAGVDFMNTTEVGLTFAPEMPADWTLSFDLGITANYRDLVGADSEFYGGGIAAMQLDWKAGANLEFGMFAGIDMSFDDTDNWNGTVRFTSSLMLSDALTAGMIAEMFYANQPAGGFRNTDFRLVATLGISI